jgi:hypothetical protein
VSIIQYSTFFVQGGQTASTGASSPALLSAASETVAAEFS